jgi:hypothetical protein
VDAREQVTHPILLYDKHEAIRLREKAPSVARVHRFLWPYGNR